MVYVEKSRSRRTEGGRDLGGNGASHRRGKDSRHSCGLEEDLGEHFDWEKKSAWIKKKELNEVIRQHRFIRGSV